MQTPLTPAEKRKLRAWAARQDPKKIACRVTRGSHWWPDITDPALKYEWDEENRRYDLVGYCARGCGCKVKYPIARKTGLTGTGHVVYSDGYQWTEVQGNPGGPMTTEAKGILRKALLEDRLDADGQS